MPVVVRLHQRDRERLVLLRGAGEQLAAELREAREAHRAEQAVRVHVLDAVVDVVATGPHVVERLRVHRVLLGRTARDRVEPDVRQLRAHELPHVDAAVLAHEARRDLGVLLRQAALEQIGRLDRVVVDADQDEVFEAHGGVPSQHKM